jgi:hypothetical protein
VTIAEYAEKVAADPANTKWVAEVRSEIADGLPELIGKDELVELKRESWEARADELAALANEEDRSASEILGTWLSHAIQIGEYLHEMHRIVPPGTWGRWRREHLTFGESTAGLYIKAWVYRDELPPGTVSYKAQALLVGRSTGFSSGTPVDPKLKAEALRLLAAGFSIRAVSREFEVRRETVQAWADPARVNRLHGEAQNRRRARKREIAEALRRGELDRLVKEKGGDLRAAYALNRRLALEVEKVLGATEDQDRRRLLIDAANNVVKVELALTTAMRTT